jgi:chromosome condensin MukBEF ATPase and DNA-binding subunit MukB
MRARIDKIAYIGWRSIDYEEIHLDGDVLTGLIGPTGAGKSTLAMFLGYALLPDRKVLDIRPISEVRDPHTAGLDLLATLIDEEYGYAYVVLDISTRLETRLIAGIHVSIKDGRGEFKKWIIENAPRHISLQDIMRVEDKDNEYYPDLPELSRKLANRPEDPMDLKQLAAVPQYGKALYEAGILPTDLSNRDDRSLYAKLIETTFRGGISAEVSAKLKDYLLPPIKRLPEIVSKLQECTEQVLKTRRALKDSNEQLDILESVYGNGKDVVIHALKRITSKKKEAENRAASLQKELSTKQNEADILVQKAPQLEKEIELAQETAKSVQATKAANLDILNANVDQLNQDSANAKRTEEDTFAKLTTFNDAEKLWRNLAGQNSGQNIEWLSEWFRNELEVANKKVYDCERNIGELQAQKADLDRSSSDTKTDALAKLLGRLTLGESFKDLDEDNARGIELTLGGLTSGVVGCTTEDLSDITADDTLPDMFWIGKEKPSPKPITTAGDWYLSSRPDGGFTVFSKHKKPIFGAQAREKRKRDIDVKVASLTDALKKLNGHLTKLKESQEQLLKSDKDIRFFIENRSQADRIKEDWLSAKARKERIERQLKEAKTERTKLQAEISELIGPYQKQIAELKENKATAERNLKSLREQIKQLEPSITEASTAASAYAQKLQRVRGILNTDFDQLLADSGKLPVSADTTYSIEQTKRIDGVSRILDDEPEARVAVFQKADPLDEVSCADLWPVLKEILRDRVPSEVLDNLNDDMIQSMRERRSHLDVQLRLQEQEVKIEAKSIYLSLRSEIRAKQQQIKRLSRLGEDLQFGNIMGIRINVLIRNEMLSILESCADQLLMFTKDSRPIEEALADYFKTQLDLKIQGQDLLDYRTYMDLVLEVRRKNRDWERASSLSGGESIGCGLAVGLMLARSLATRGEIRVEHLTPLFVVDEVHRLDATGQKTIIEFGQKEGFQVLVTAAALVPEYKCTLYALSRVFMPEERLVIRGVRIKTPQKT